MCGKRKEMAKEKNKQTQAQEIKKKD